MRERGGEYGEALVSAGQRVRKTVRFLGESVRESRGEQLFDVVIRYADPDEIPPGGTASRKVSYRARCDSKELSISVIVLRNVKGQTTKAISVPPGAEGETWKVHGYDLRAAGARPLEVPSGPDSPPAR